jgi:hypothetical protein
MNKEINKEMNKEITKLNTKLTQKNITKLTTKQYQKLTPSNKIPRTPYNPRKTTILPPPFDFKIKEYGLKGKKQRGYFTFIKRFGKFIKQPGIRGKGKALMFGEKIAKSTLAATFKVKPSKQFIYGSGYSYKPSSNIFRATRIKKGRRIPLKDTFIQKRGKRLSYEGEIAEIQLAKILKGGKK